ncbi:hypothetical protein GCM10011351_20850 [Paraliobacillus quinghaiensis]|uniref:Helix-turn-helix domain-containing protein n=1 Tax=Paraliobacillus quinghaiensis TaxID=470815 RepID=A0A917TRX8_9BACI|nr:helix-turn-helix domain-containing protein [Paraliobacillus quinghaiensis]GGM34672.1 hypothetical protein GCM10011351_20850 [Paraliobacillus quinghaiensis]
MNKLSFEVPQGFADKYFEELVQMNREAIEEIVSFSQVERRYLTKKEACDYLNVSYQTLQSMITNGLNTIKIGSKYFIDVQDIHIFMKKHKK